MILPLKIPKATCKVDGTNNSSPCWPFQKLRGLQGCFELPQNKILLQKRLLVIADYIEEGTFESTYFRGQLTISEQRAWVLSELQRGSSPSLLITMFKGTGAAEDNLRLWSTT